MKARKLLAVAMAATLALSMSITAFAADGDATGNGSVDGAGTSEGHVEQKHMNVVLPTATASTFAYTIDPERLIQTTGGGKYAEGTTFPAAASDTGVYFLVGEKTYANTSNELQVINKSSADVKVSLTVKTTPSEGNKDIALATAALSSSETSAKLYLAATIGEGDDKATQILSSTPETIDRKLEGTPGNYEIIVGENETSHEKEYQYKQKTAGLSAWKALKFSITGAVTEGIAIASDTTAPKITVTWAFAEPTASDTSLSDDGVGTFSEDSAPSIANTNITVTADTAIAIPVNLGAGSLAATSVTSAALNGTGTLELLDGSGTFATYSNGTLTLTAALANFIIENPTVTLDVVFDDDEETTVNIEFTVE